MKYKHTIYALLYLAALAVVSYAFPACTREEMSGRLEIFYTGVTDIAPSQEVIIDAPTYRGETPGNFEITGITLNGEPFSTESIRINDTATGEILVTETENLPVGTYLVSIACTSGGRRYEFPDIIQVEMLMPVPDGISVEPAEVTVNLADLNIDSPTAKVVVDERKSIRVKRYSLIQENSWFEVSGDGVISVNPEYEDEILAGDYRLDLKIETDLGKALFEDAVLFHIVSAPRSITYHGSGMMIESGEEYVFEVSMMNGSAEALEYTLVSVTPALENAGDIVLDPHSGAVTVARGNSLVREEEYAVTVKASNVYGETVFEPALTFTAVGQVAEITEFSYRSQNIPQFESYTFGVDRMDGSYVQYSLKNVPETLSGLLSIDADSGEITLSDNSLSPGVYYVTVTAENIKGSMDASFRLAIVKHPYHFDDVRYSSGQNAEYSLLPDVNAFSYTKLAVMQADVLYESTSITYTPDYFDRLSKEFPGDFEGADETMRSFDPANPPAEMRFILRSFSPERAALPGAAPYFHAKALEALSALLMRSKPAETKAQQEDRALVERAEALISTHLAEPLTVASIAAELYVGRSKLCEAFRRVRGKGVAELLRQERMNAALRLIASGDTDIVSSVRL